MNLQKKNKHIAHAVLAIIILFAIGAIAYQLMDRKPQVIVQEAPVPQGSPLQLITLNEQQLAQREAIIKSLEQNRPVPLTPEQLAQREAILKTVEQNQK